ncbi:MAG TPA: histidine kinase [Chitinophagales bacterium]|nr:histidine kinase [Chitinophagales bacterium]
MTTTQRRILFHAIGCILFLSLPVLFSPNLSVSIGLLSIPSFQRVFFTYVLILLFFYFHFYYLLPTFYFTQKYIRYGFFIAACYAVIVYVPHALIPHQQGGHMGHAVHHSHGLLHQAGHYFFQVLMVIVFSLLLKVNDRLKITEQERYKAELSYLRAQVNPHFLFNTLNGIYSLALDKSDKTARAIVDLSNLMRYVTTGTNRDLVSLDEEIVYLTNYINLQLIRLGDTVKVDFKLRGKMEGRSIAPLLLIPFIENAFKYGINPEWSTSIRIEIEMVESQLHLHVFNLVVNEDPTGSKLGIKNTRARLLALYPNKHRLLIIDEKTEYTVDLKIDLG